MNHPGTRYLRWALGAAALLLVGLEIAALALFPHIADAPSASPQKKIEGIVREEAGVTKTRPATPVRRGGFGIQGMPPFEEMIKWMSPEDAKLLQEHAEEARLLQQNGQQLAYKGETKYFMYGNAWTGEEGPVVLVYLDGVQIHPDPDELYGKSPRISTDDSLRGAKKKAVIDLVFAALEERGTTAEEASQELVEQLYEQAKASLGGQAESTSVAPKN